MENKVIVRGKAYFEDVELELVAEDQRVKLTLIEGFKYAEAKLQKKLERAIERLKPIGGTFHIPKNYLLAGYLAIDEVLEVKEKKVVGELETIPYEDGVIY